MTGQPVLSVILPCRNEEAGLEFCLPSIHSVIERLNLPAEVIVVDNGSTDQSVPIARKHGVLVVPEPVPGYGAACMKGMETARGKYFFLADPDGSYNFDEIPIFLEKLRQGHDLVIGNRLKGKIDTGAMPWTHRHIGNPLLSFLLRLFYSTMVHDTQCGMRALTREAYQKLSLRTTGMEFASEMIVAALKRNLRIAEKPIHYHKRKGTSKLKRFADGWRHLRFILLYKPFVLFFLPGLLLLAAGVISFAFFYSGNATLFQVRFDYHPIFLSSLLIITGFQLMLFALFAKTYAITHLEDTPALDRFYRYANIETASVFGILVVLLGGAIYLGIFAKWLKSHLGALNEVKNAILGLTLVVLGIQTVFSAFMLSILGIRRRQDR